MRDRNLPGAFTADDAEALAPAVRPRPGSVDWDAYQKCPGCGAELGQPCRSLTGVTAGVGPVGVLADQPHGTRQRRAGR